MASMQPEELLRGLEQERARPEVWRALTQTAEVASWLIGVSVEEATERVGQGNCGLQVIDMDLELPPGTGRGSTGRLQAQADPRRVGEGSVLNVSVG